MKMNSTFNKLELLDRAEDILAHHHMPALTRPFHLDGQASHSPSPGWGFWSAKKLE
jgi:hypothetical protein